ncbi:hypothetical protein B0H11DRAFT_2169261 [Mycena galericulata]|nr:hypothetical protein B0H11DRAFT_2169261 [Mycena galericulata]
MANRENWYTDVLEKAFDKPHNKYSAIALELFITQKCIVENLGHSTGENIHAAFAKYWDIGTQSRDEDKYAGEYHYDEETEKVTGCPARAGIVQSLLKAIKVRAKEKGTAATRNHAEAISAEDMKVMMDWSESVCPSSKLAEAVKSGVAPRDRATRNLLLKHGMMRAFSASGFTLWTRNFELCGLQMRDLTLDCVGPLPFSHPYFKVFLDGRKGWQHKQGYDGTRESNEYNIYSQPDLPALDMHKYLLLWIPFYELCLGRKLEDDDFIFPYIAANGTIHPKREMTLQIFRRGGAQYRFWFAPLGKRWSLNIVRWWGGWASGEHVDTLMKYLLDSLQSYEIGHSDALCPVPHEADKSFMGDHLMVKPVPTEEFRAVTSQIITQLSKISLNQPHCICSHTSSTPSSDVMPSHRVAAPVLQDSSAQAATVGAHMAASNSPSAPAQPPHTESVARPIPISQQITIIPGVVIPDLKKGNTAWRDAVRQWEEGDPAKGLSPLRDWPRAWYSDGMRLVTGTKRSQRKLIFDEFERQVLGRDESELIRTYPVAYKKISALLLAIRENNKARGVSSGRRSSKRGSTE